LFCTHCQQFPVSGLRSPSSGHTFRPHHPYSLRSALNTLPLGTMTSIGGYSDTLLDYMRAREASHRRDMHARSPSPVVRKGVDSTELDCVGAHLVLSTKDQSYPTSIGDLTDDEVASLKSGPTPKPLKTVVQPQPRPDGNSPSGESSTARTYTPKASGQYLPPSEMEEFWRQRSISFAYRTGT
jgi:hypothetical protein